MRVTQTTWTRGRRSERVLIETEDADLARIVAFVYGATARKGTVTAVEDDAGDVIAAEIATRAHRLKTPANEGCERKEHSRDE